MYHIKNDMRSIKSAELIYEGLMECLKEKPFEKISITDIQKMSTVGRATFYRHFDSLIDVLYWKCNQHFFEAVDSFTKLDHDKEKRDDFLVYTFKYWVNHSENIEQLLKIGRTDIIFKCHKDNSHIIRGYYKKMLNLPDENVEYYMSIRNGVFIGMFTTWIETGKKESAEELVTLLIEQLDFIKESKVLL